jgi:hypothetical protein
MHGCMQKRRRAYALGDEHLGDRES